MPGLCVLAAMVTRIAYSEAQLFLERAHKISAAAAEPYDQDLENAASHAQLEHESQFHRIHRAARLGIRRAAETMPCLLSNA